MKGYTVLRTRTILSRIGAAALVAGTLAVSLPSPASADPAPLEIYIGGELKARGTYNDANNRLCVKVFNATSGASAKLWSSVGGTMWAANDLHGGDNDGGCQEIHNASGWENTTQTWTLSFTSSTGNTTTKSGSYQV